MDAGSRVGWGLVVMEEEDEIVEQRNGCSSGIGGMVDLAKQICPFYVSETEVRMDSVQGQLKDTHQKHESKGFFWSDWQNPLNSLSVAGSQPQIGAKATSHLPEIFYVYKSSSIYSQKFSSKTFSMFGIHSVIGWRLGDIIAIGEVVFRLIPSIIDAYGNATSDKEVPMVTTYMQMAQEMDKNPEIGVFRRFGELNNLNLLYMQAELLILERKLLQQQNDDLKSSCERTRLYCYSMEALILSEGDGGTKQRDLLLEIQVKLKAYSKLPSPTSSKLILWDR